MSVVKGTQEEELPVFCKNLYQRHENELTISSHTMSLGTRKGAYFVFLEESFIEFLPIS